MGRYQPLLKIAQYGSLTKAAQELGYNQSSLTYITNQIEEELGVKIFRRSRHGTSMTPVGEKLIRVMEQVELLEQDLQHIALSHRVGTIRIGAFSSVTMEWLPSILKQMYRRYPGLSIFIEQIDTYAELEQGLENGSLDCGFFAGEHQPQFAFTPLYQDAYYVVLQRKSPLAMRDALTLEDILAEPFLLPSEALDVKGALQAVYQALSGGGNIYSRSKNDFVTVSMVGQGLGVTIMPGLFLDQIAPDIAICAVPLAPTVHRTLGILSRKKEDSTDVTQVFIETAQELLAKKQPKPPWA